MKIAPEQARANIIAAYTKQHNEGVDALSAAIDRARASKTDTKAETDQASKAELSKLLLESARDDESAIWQGLYSLSTRQKQSWCVFSLFYGQPTKRKARRVTKTRRAFGTKTNTKSSQVKLLLTAITTIASTDRQFQLHLSHVARDI